MPEHTDGMSIKRLATDGHQGKGWRYRGRVRVAHSGQPVTGRDADSAGESRPPRPAGRSPAPLATQPDSAASSANLRLKDTPPGRIVHFRVT